MDILGKFNLFEAALWFIISIIFFLQALYRKITQGLRNNFLFLGLVFIIFGISDLIEIKSGAWWDPIWLLALKGCCILGIIIGVIRLYFKKIANNNGV